MNLYIRAIGFQYLDADFEEEMIHAGILDSIEKGFVIKNTKLNRGAVIVRVSESTGLYIYGRFKGDEFIYEYYFPFILGKTSCDNDEITIERHLDKESFAVVCDESRTGVTLIFYLQNVCDYLSEKAYINREVRAKGAVLSGLSVDGCILLPMKQKKAKTLNTVDSDKKDRKQLIAEARDGDEGAMESLTMEDIDLYSSITRRIQNEDILSIVTTYFMPYGIESDQYSVLGDIIEFTEEKNIITNEKIYCIKVSCNDIIFSVCINKNDLIGEPMVGRRFKGNIWMQGSICL